MDFEEYKNLWPTVLAKGKFDTSGLVEHILSRYDMKNLKSELSDYNLFSDDDAVIIKFQDMAYNAFDDYLKTTINKSISDWGKYKLKAWITGHGKNYNMTIHNHSGAHLSGVFYILAEEKSSGGDIVFTDPRANANRGYDDKFSPMFERHAITPESGDFMIFPSFTYHHVNPYYSRLRICVPVDLFLYRG
jgi:hypothetical protein